MRILTVNGNSFEVPHTAIPQSVRISRLPDGTHEKLNWPANEAPHVSAVAGAVTVAYVTLTDPIVVHEGNEAGIAVTDATLEDLLAVARSRKKAELASVRYEAEIAGTTVDGVSIATDRESQALITGAALAASLDPAYTLKWKTTSGAFVTLTAAQVTAIAQAVRSHVQGCFDKEALLGTQADTAETVAAVEAVHW